MPQGRAEGRSPSAFFSIPQEWGLRGLKLSPETLGEGVWGRGVNPGSERVSPGLWPTSTASGTMMN